MYQRILVPVDSSPTSNAGLAEALKLAQLTGGRVRRLHVVDDMPFILRADSMGAMTSDLLDLLRKAGERILTAPRASVEAEGVAVDTQLFDSLDCRSSERLAQQVAEWKEDLIVLGTHGRRGVGRMLLGSDAEQVIGTSTVPVWLVRSNGDAEASTGAVGQPAPPAP